jgi:5-dehydro-4-deoxyglucarate dehydratase
MMPAVEMARRIGSGLLSFPVTHFDKQLAFDEGSYRAHCDWLLQHEVAGLLRPAAPASFSR